MQSLPNLSSFWSPRVEKANACTDIYCSSNEALNSVPQFLHNSNSTIYEQIGIGQVEWSPMMSSVSSLEL